MVAQLIEFNFLDGNPVNEEIASFIIAQEWTGWSSNQKRSWLNFVYGGNLLECVITHLGNDMINWRVLRRSSIPGGFNEGADRNLVVDGIDLEISRILN